MAEIILSQAGAVAGQHLLPQGLTVLGQTIGGAALGRAAGSLVGRHIDASLASPLSGPRIENFRVTESREGAPIPAVYGRMRIGGQVIWAAKFKERRQDQSAGKGGPKYTEYSYSVSFAVALCEGPITRVDRVWANGELLSLANYNWRLYHGDQDQLPDPLIEAVEGFGRAPAYRGTAYIVFEDLPLDPFGNRLPQLSFELVRAGNESSDALPNKVSGVNIIPATGEFVYGSRIVSERRFPGIETAINMNNSDGRADFALSVDQLKSDLPNVATANLAVAWFGDDLRVGQCGVRPCVETHNRKTVPYQWSVDSVGRGDAALVSATDGRANYGGTPADQSVLEGLAVLDAAGIAVTMLPFLLMDVSPGNGLTDPYGGVEQAPFPWRGRITSELDGTAAARTEIDTFLGADGSFGYRHFILHYARLAAQAGNVEAFLIGSEMATLTRIRDADGKFPFVEGLIALAGEVRAIVGPLVKVSYAADWTEYGSFVPDDGSGDVLFPLDDLWASPDIDFVGVDWYPPAGDWRDGDAHIDAIAGYSEADEEAYLLANMAGGEGYDWYYADETGRNSQTRLPIVDGAYGEDWVFRQKDLKNWWQNAHFARVAGVKAGTPTSWQPESKPIRLVEIGFPAIDRGGNSPNLFYDPKSAESAFPPFSSGARDDLFQRRALTTALSYWQAQPFIENASVWAWDGRPWPYFPYLKEIWSDGSNWQFGHWLNGRMGLIEVASIVDDISRRADLAISTHELAGFAEGFVLSSQTSVRAALAPLETAYGLDFVEANGVIEARQLRDSVVATIDPDEIVSDSYTRQYSMLDKTVSRLSLNYVSGSTSYEPAIVIAQSDRDAAGEDNSVSLPLLLSEARANALAQSLLSAAREPDAVDFTLSLEHVALEPGDLIEMDGSQVYKLQEVRHSGLAVSAKGQHILAASGAQRYVDATPVGNLALIEAAPEFFLVDIDMDLPLAPGRAHVAASSRPWGGRADIRLGSALDNLQTRAIVTSPAGIGFTMASVPAGPLGRWDNNAHIDVFIEGEVLASSDRLSVLSGRGRLALRSETGWELVGYSDAELVSENHWRVSGLLRGLNGTQIVDVSENAVVVLVDDRLVPLELSQDETNRELLWVAGAADAQPLNFISDLSRPLRVGHLRAEPLAAGGWHISWTRRGREIADDWSLDEAPAQGSFRVDLIAGGSVLSTTEIEDPEILISGGYDEVSVASVSPSGRFGPEVSIPLL